MIIENTKNILLLTPFMAFLLTFFLLFTVFECVSPSFRLTLGLWLLISFQEPRQDKIT